MGFQFNISTYSSQACADIDVVLTLPNNGQIRFKGDCLTVFSWPESAYSLKENDVMTVVQAEPKLTIRMKVQSIKGVLQVNTLRPVEVVPAASVYSTMIDIKTLLKQADCPNFLLQIQVGGHYVYNDMTYYQCTIQVTWGSAVAAQIVEKAPALTIKGTADGYKPIDAAVELTAEKMQQLTQGDTGLQLDVSSFVSDAGLSTGAIVGIVVGSAAALVLVVLAVVFSIKKKKNPEQVQKVKGKKVLKLTPLE